MQGQAEILEAIQAMSALCVAFFDLDGWLVEANAGFRAVIERPERDGVPLNLRQVLQMPTFAWLEAQDRSPSGPIFDGLLTLGWPESAGCTLKARVLVQPGGLLLVAEHDVLELRRIASQAFRLTDELAEQGRALAASNRQLKRQEQKILALSLTDPLTGVANRRHLEEVLRAEWGRAQRQGTALSLVMADIDHFKRVNDRFGHEMGDNALVAFAGLMREGVRTSDLVARFGGEEFVLVLPDCELEAAVILAERLCFGTTVLRFPLPELRITASFGVACIMPGESPEACLSRADQALYEAKARGRNQVRKAAYTASSSQDQSPLDLAQG